MKASKNEMVDKSPLRQRILDAPDTLRLAILSAWRGRQRGAAVFAGVFLAALVISTVLAYTNGLMQVFFEESLETDLYDIRMDFFSSPGGDGRTDDPSLLKDACAVYLKEELVTDCSLAFGRGAQHTDSFFGPESMLAQPLMFEAVTGSGADWTNISLGDDGAMEEGPPTLGNYAIRFVDDSLFDGELAKRHNSTMLFGEWPDSGEDALAERTVVVPWDFAQKTGVEVGDKLDSINFSFTVHPTQPCNEPNQSIVSMYDIKLCREVTTIENLTVGGIYDDSMPWNPLVSNSVSILHLDLLPLSIQQKLMSGDHSYLAITLDRGKFDSGTVSDIEDQLDELGARMEDSELEGNIELETVNIVTSSIGFLNILVIFIQIFDYIIMIPIVVLSLSVLVFGLILSLEQRRREIAINRTMGGSAATLQKMVRSELLVMSLVAWLLGWMGALLAARWLLNAVGFLSFTNKMVDFHPSLSFGQLTFTLFVSVGLALLFGRSRTKEFLSLEIAEGVAAVSAKAPPKRWVHWLLFLSGLVSLIDSILDEADWAEGTALEGGLVDQIVLDGLLSIFGPFLLWIGGAFVLAGIGARGPAVASLLFGRTTLLRDIRRGLRSSGSAEGVSRLAIILVLSLSVVTMAAVQGYTGADVDKRAASAEVGSDLRVEFNAPISNNEALDLVLTALSEAGESTDDVGLMTIPLVNLNPSGNEMTTYQVGVILDDAESVLMFDDQSLGGKNTEQLSAIRDGGFTAGEKAAFDLRLEKKDGGGPGRRLAGGTSSTGTSEITFNYTIEGEVLSQLKLDYVGQHEWMPGSTLAGLSGGMLIGETSWEDLTGLSATNITSTIWYFDIGKVGHKDGGEALISVAREFGALEGVSEVSNWESTHRGMERDGGLVFGTQGLLSLQFVVASLAAVATSFVFLTLVLHQRHKELAIVQAIGGTRNQVFRLVLFEVISIVIASMAMGLLLGLGLSYAFNGLFNFFGVIFQIFQNTGSPISRDLVWPVWELTLISLSVLGAVVVALLLTVRNALTADLSESLKGE